MGVLILVNYQHHTDVQAFPLIFQEVLSINGGRDLRTMRDIKDGGELRLAVEKMVRKYVNISIIASN